MIDPNMMSSGLKLCMLAIIVDKNNSAIEIEQKANETQEIKYYHCECSLLIFMHCPFSSNLNKLKVINMKSNIISLKQFVSLL